MLKNTHTHIYWFVPYFLLWRTAQWTLAVVDIDFCFTSYSNAHWSINWILIWILTRFPSCSVERSLFRIVQSGKWVYFLLFFYLLLLLCSVWKWKRKWIYRCAKCALTNLKIQLSTRSAPYAWRIILLNILYRISVGCVMLSPIPV